MQSLLYRFVHLSRLSAAGCLLSACLLISWLHGAALALGGNDHVPTVGTPPQGADLSDVSDDGLILHYTFDSDPAGTVVDHTGNGHVGTIYGSPQYVPGLDGLALSFSNPQGQVPATQYVAISNTAYLAAAATSSVTICVLYTSTDTSQSNGRILGTGDWRAGPSVTLLYNANISASAYSVFNDDTWFLRVGRSSPDPDALTTDGLYHWHVVTLNRDTLALAHYVDEKLIEERDVDPSFGTISLQNLVLGAASLPDPSDADNCAARLTTVDQLRIYNRALSSNEVATLAASLPPDLRRDLVIAGQPAEHGTSTPYGYGTNRVQAGTAITESVATPVSEVPGTRHVCTGWVGTGSAPATGISNQVAFTIQEASSVTWLWQTQHDIAILASAHGSVDVASGWYADGAELTVNADAQAGYHFTSWSGDVPGGHENANPLTLPVDQARTVTASFDLDLPSFAITRPVAGDRFNPGDVIQIQWTGIAPLGPVNVELWSGAQRLAVLTNGLPTTGTGGLLSVPLPFGYGFGNDFYLVMVDADNPGDFQQSAAFSVLPAAARDMNGDGCSDLVVFDPSTANWYAQSPVDAQTILWMRQWGFGGVRPLCGDFDGNGICDIAVYGAAGGSWYLRSVAGPILGWGLSWGGGGLDPYVADFDGDGACDLAVYDPVFGFWYIRTALSNQTIAWQVQWGGAGMEPVIGDYDGDGKADLGVYSRSDGRWYVRALTGETLAWMIPWGGGSSFEPVPGDYDADGACDMALYDTVSGRWYIRNLAGRILVWGAQWGFPGVTPVAGDYDGDGISDLALYHQPSGTWYIRDLAGNVLALGHPWGWSAAEPVIGDRLSVIGDR